MKGLNIKGLIKQIKQSKNQFIWSYNADGHFLTNRHWAIELEKLPIDVEIALLQTFGERPAVGQYISKFASIVAVGEKLGIPKWGIDLKPCEWTNYYMDSNDYLMRIFKQDNALFHVNSDYLQAIEYGVAAHSDGTSKPVVFKDISYVVLPFRIGTNGDVDIQNKILGGDSDATS